MLPTVNFLWYIGCWHFNIYEQEKFNAQLTWAWKKFYNLGAWLVHLYDESSQNISNHEIKIYDELKSRTQQKGLIVTPWSPWGVTQHHRNTGATDNLQCNPEWPSNRQDMVRPKSTKINNIMSVHHWLWCTTKRRTVDEGSKVIYRVGDNYFTCRLPHYIYIISNTL